MRLFHLPFPTPPHPHLTFLRHLSLRYSTKSMPFSSQTPITTQQQQQQQQSTRRKKPRRDTPEQLLARDLDQCSKHRDATQALKLYDSALSIHTPLSLRHYNNLLYLCSVSNNNAFERRGFEIFRHMESVGIAPNEATLTSLARLAAARRDPHLAFDIVKRMATAGIPPRLRSYGPALFGFCESREVGFAHEVEKHMDENGVIPEEEELVALLSANVEKRRGEDVYRILHRIRVLVRKVSEKTAEVVREWFESEAAAEVGVEEWDVGKVKEGVVKGGGGWHGQGWLRKGPWSVAKMEVDKDGICGHCGERLVCIDIDPKETEGFKNSLATLACQREVKADFIRFQEWLDHHGPFDAVIDAANIGHLQGKHFCFSHINYVVNGIRQITRSKKLPLIILHANRLKGGLADQPNNKKLIEGWLRSGALYATPYGSNDDWYWLYAAVRCQSLVVTNDEMRDHLFQLLGTSFFPRWKEKHQVRLTVSGGSPAFHLPPPYSIVIQESEVGSWHIPTVTGDDIEKPRQWICANRNSNVESSQQRPRLSQMG